MLQKVKKKYALKFHTCLRRTALWKGSAVRVDCSGASMFRRQPEDLHHVISRLASQPSGNMVRKAGCPFDTRLQSGPSHIPVVKLVQMPKTNVPGVQQKLHLITNSISSFAITPVDSYKEEVPQQLWGSELKMAKVACLFFLYKPRYGRHVTLNDYLAIFHINSTIGVFQFFQPMSHP